ncbi:MAG: hypothetical protein H6571_04810 [Lewinellaceae bacterium]|nr:hypothetical protein [Lewinellaceae bacterium]
MNRCFLFTAPSTGSYDIAVSSSSGYVDLFYKSSACSGTGWSYVDDINTSGATNTLSLTGGTTLIYSLSMMKILQLLQNFLFL